MNAVRPRLRVDGDIFEPLDDHPAYRQIAKLIEQRIVGRVLRAGDALPSESDLARQFGVNRSTVREAIRELETHGLLGRGRGEKRLRVTRPQAKHVSKGVSRALALNDVTYLELWEAMMAIEPAAAQYAATRRTAAQLQAIGAVAPVVSNTVPNQLTMPWVKATDFRISWKHTFKERYTIEPNVGIYNIFNFANFNLPPGTMSGWLNEGAGSINSIQGGTGEVLPYRTGAGTGVFGLGAPRAMEWGLKLSF